MKTLLVNELFFSCQGEGHSLGMPAIFLRLAGCNLSCGRNGGWQCDTPYAWDWKKHDFDQEVRRVSVDDLLMEQAQYDCFNLVVTGGEPLIQQDQLREFLVALKHASSPWWVEVETNGTISPFGSPFGLLMQVDQWNVSPKLSSFGDPAERRIRPEALEMFASMDNAYFKFVVSNDDDVAEMEATYLKQFHPRTQPIYLMAEGKTPEAQQAKQKWLIEVVKRSGGKYWYTPRAQVLIWGTQRRV